MNGALNKSIKFNKFYAADNKQLEYECPIHTIMIANTHIPLRLLNDLSSPSVFKSFLKFSCIEKHPSAFYRLFHGVLAKVLIVPIIDKMITSPNIELTIQKDAGYASYSSNAGNQTYTPAFIPYGI